MILVKPAECLEVTRFEFMCGTTKRVVNAPASYSEVQS
jgi:hypothetical protein